jgi:hypothetical protein
MRPAPLDLRILNLGTEKAFMNIWKYLPVELYFYSTFSPDHFALPFVWILGLCLCVCFSFASAGGGCGYAEQSGSPPVAKPLGDAVLLPEDMPAASACSSYTLLSLDALVYSYWICLGRVG